MGCKDDIIDSDKSKFARKQKMDIWETLYFKAKEQYHPVEVTPFVYAHHVVCALESENGAIYTGFCVESCSGVMNLCAERVAALNMYVNSGQTVIKRLIAFRDKAPYGDGSGMPCGACREFLMQLSCKNRDMEIMVDYQKRETVTLKELMPNWWGEDRYNNTSN
jgi:cytidine deaminase